MNKTKRFLVGSIAVCVICIVAGNANASINFLSVQDPDGTLNTPYNSLPYGAPGLVTVDNFGVGADRVTGRPGWDWGVSPNDNGTIISGSTTNNAAPWNDVTGLRDATNYYTVPTEVNITPRSSMVVFGADYDYLGLFWGSIDTYNTITFINRVETTTPGVFDYTDVVASYGGGDIIYPSAANGGQESASTNTYVNFVDMPTFNTVLFTSSNYAFEFDNVAVGNNVPVPGAALLGAMGLGMVGWMKRRKQQA